MYIAAQGPTEELINDFWRMIWEQKCRKIVMLTKLIEQTKVGCLNTVSNDSQVLLNSQGNVIFIEALQYINIKGERSIFEWGCQI